MDRDQVLNEISKTEVTLWTGDQTRIAVTTGDAVGGGYMLVYRVYALDPYSSSTMSRLVDTTPYLEDVVEEVLLHENRKVRFSIEGKDGDHYKILNENGHTCVTAETKADAKKIAELLDRIEDLKEKL